MRSFDVVATAIALRVDRKWVDNVLSHHAVPGVVALRQGVSRRLSPDAVLILALMLHLIAELGVPLARALDLSSQLVADGGRVRTDGGMEIVVDLPRLQEDVTRRLAEAAEAAPPRRRGRPRRRPQP